MYATGRGVPQDDAEAVRWFRLAAEQGHATGQYNLGFRYDAGQGVPQDAAEAARWFRLAAEQGDASAQSRLGLKYATGEGVPQDYVSAHMWLNLAAAAGVARGGAGAREALKMVAESMTREQIAQAQARAREWANANR